MKPAIKSIGAVLAGFLCVVILSSVTDAVLEGTGIFPPTTKPNDYVTWMLVLALLYRTLYTILAGYLTAMLAPSNPMKHVKVLAVLGTIGGIIGVVVGWNLSEHWYPIALAVLAFPSVWYGGRIKTQRKP